MSSALLHDVLIVGGGPAGATAATLLAKRGHAVVVLEKERFPRFHIGESLLPYNRRIFEEMGVWEAVAKAGFPRKFGAQFHLANDSRKIGFDFRQGRFNQVREALQVERAVFDQLLLEHAAKSGATVRSGVCVNQVEAGAESVRLDVALPSGEMESISGRFLIDASGRANLTGDQEGLKQMHPSLRKLSVFGHFSGVRLDEGERAGDTVIVRMEGGWFWIIPIGHDKVSVGCVIDKAEFPSGKGAAALAFWGRVKSSVVLGERMKRAELLGALHVTTDFSYRNRRFAEGRVVRAGDAAGFIDPIFSSGVYLAMYSAREAAHMLSAALRNPGAATARSFKDYDRRVSGAMDFYLKMVEGFYTRSFMEILLHPNPRWGLAAAVNAMLAGDLDARWPIRWRLRIFHLLVWLQSRYPIAPRLRFS